MKERRMMKKRINNVMRKEWKNIFSNINSALFITLVPIFLTVQALIIIYLVINFAGAETLINTILGKGLENWVAMFPELSGLSISERFQVFFFGQFPFYLLMVPVMVAISFATFSIVEEKQNKTLEPLLATPVRTWELLMGKSLAGAIPSILITWFCAGLFLLIIILMGSGGLLGFILNVQWFVSLFILVPLVTLLAFMLGVIASSRAKDPKGAQNIAIVIILPIIALYASQLIGFIVFDIVKLFILSILLIVLNVLILRIAIRLFQRESIVISWR